MKLQWYYRQNEERTVMQYVKRHFRELCILTGGFELVVAFYHSVAENWASRTPRLLRNLCSSSLQLAYWDYTILWKSPIASSSMQILYSLTTFHVFASNYTELRHIIMYDPSISSGFSAVYLPGFYYMSSRLQHSYYIRKLHSNITVCRNRDFSQFAIQL